MSINLEQQIKCVRRELALRQNVYPKWVAAGKKKKDDADHEIEAMKAVHDTLMSVQLGTVTTKIVVPNAEQPEPVRHPVSGETLFGIDGVDGPRR